VTAKKTAAKKTVKKAARPRALTEAEAVAVASEEVKRIITEDGATIGEDTATDEDTAAALPTVNLALSHRGTRTGATHPVRVHRPTETQLVWFEAAAHRFDLAMEAWKEGAALGAGERGEVYNDALNAMNVFVATRFDRMWVSQAMASGLLELDAVIEGIHQAKDVLDLAPGAGTGADIVVP
jgi:hypothetical protein